MKRNFTILFISIFSFLSGFAQLSQENGMAVQAVLSPRTSITYHTVDSFDFEVRIKNLGPNELIPGDRIRVAYSIGDGGPSSIDSTILIPIGNSNMRVNHVRDFTLIQNFKINANSVFSACADVEGTALYPINTHKNSSKCELFVVGIEKQQLKIDRVFFSNNQIHIKLNQAGQLNLEVFDITGKSLLTRELRNKSSETIPFKAPSSGFYFIKLVSNNGDHASSKFVVN